MSEQKIPDDPMSELATAAASLHELYLSLVAAGFTETQALYLVGQAMTGQQNQGGTA